MGGVPDTDLRRYRARLSVAMRLSFCGSTPPLAPPLKGEGELPRAKSPSPLRGGVRGGGNGTDFTDGMGLDVHEACATLDIPLGPEIGQCCGGRVEVAIRPVDEKIAADLIAAAERQEARLPHLYIFGGGHVGKALAAAVSLLPVRAIVVETRAEELEGMPQGVETRLTPMPEAAVRDAPADLPGVQEINSTVALSEVKATTALPIG